MTGRAYNPQGYDPEVKGRFSAPPPQVMKAFAESWAKELSSMREHVPYEEAMKYLNRGEGANLGHYVYEMLYDIYAGIEDKLLEGAWDTHLHIYPDYVPRGIDMIDLAIEASKVKMGGIVCKDHFFSNVGAAWGAQRYIDDMVKRGELDYACKVLGTNIFAWCYHPDQVNLIRKYPNLGAIFFRTMTGGGVMAGSDIPIVDDKGKVVPQVRECIRLCAEYKIPIMTGHVGLIGERPEELMVLIRTAHEYGAHIMVTHGQHFGSMSDKSDLEEALKLGAYLEVNGTGMVPNMMHPCIDPNAACDFIREVGPEKCIFNTDWGQPFVYDPVDGMRICIRMLLHFGFTEEEIRTMLKTNPEKYLFIGG
jgi:hypothetical protein